MNMTVGKLKDLLGKIPDEYEIVMHGTTPAYDYNEIYWDDLEKLVTFDDRLVLTTDSHYDRALKNNRDYVPVDDLERNDNNGRDY